MTSTHQRSDRFTLSYGLAVGAVLIYADALQELDYAFGFSPWSVFLLILLALATFVFILQGLIRHLLLWRWRRLVSLIVLPVAAIGSFLALRAHGIDATWLRFQLAKPIYLAELNMRNKDHGEPVLLAWNWDVGGAAKGYDSTAGIIYDDSDTLALPPRQRPTALRQRLLALDPGDLTLPGIRQLGGDYLTSVRRLEGHFYLVEEMYD